MDKKQQQSKHIRKCSGYMSLGIVAATCPLVCPDNFKLMLQEGFGQFCPRDMLLRVQLIELYGTCRREKMLQGSNIPFCELHTIL